jgi:hypothetical protein
MTPFHWNKAAVIVLSLIVALSLACANEENTPPQPDTPTQVVNSTSTPEPTTGPIATVAIPTKAIEIPETATPSLDNLPIPSTPTAVRQLQSLSSIQPIVPPSPPRLGNVQMFPLSPQQSGELNGLTVFAVGSMTVTADEAYVVVVQERFGRLGPEPLSGRDQADVLEQLGQIGISEEDVDFETDPRFGPYTNVVVKVPTDQLPQIGENVVEAVESALGRSDSSGLRLGLSNESCQSAVSQARRKVIPQAQESASDLAQALGVTLGQVTGVLEYPTNTFDPYTPNNLDRCSPPRSFGPEGLLPFDSNLNMEVPVQLQITFAME